MTGYMEFEKFAHYNVRRQEHSKHKKQTHHLKVQISVTHHGHVHVILTSKRKTLDRRKPHVIVVVN